MTYFQRSRPVALLVSLAVVAVFTGCFSSCIPDGRNSALTTPNTTGPDADANDNDWDDDGSNRRTVLPVIAAGGDMVMVPIELELPPPVFKGTPTPGSEPNVEKPRGKPREPFYAPIGTTNLALGKPVTSSDPVPAAGEVDYVTDGAKEASDFGYLELRPGTEWVQIDLQESISIYAVVLWHNHADARVYRDVIIQVSDDPDFLEAITVFNNDFNGSSGMGIGPDMGYVETNEGKLVDCGGAQARYVRLYSRGNHIDAQNNNDKNHYTEVEIFGRPIPTDPEAQDEAEEEDEEEAESEDEEEDEDDDTDEAKTPETTS